MLDLIIIGGGAAGLAAACAAARPGRRVVLLEKQSRVGRKLLATGNGRCNLTRLGAKPSDYFGARGAAATALRLCPPEDVLTFFDELGLPAAPDEEGRVYPLSNQAASVLDALRLSAAERGCEIRTDCAAEEIRAEGNSQARSARSDAQSRGQKEARQVPRAKAPPCKRIKRLPALLHSARERRERAGSFAAPPLPFG